MTALDPLRRFEFDEDVSLIRADLHQPLLLMNLGYHAIRVTNVDSMTHGTVDYSELSPEFLIHEWLVDLDGRCSLLISSDPIDFGIGIDHSTWKPFRFDLPSNFPRLANICRTEPSLRLFDVHGRVWTSETGRLVVASATAQLQEPERTEASSAKRYAIFSHDGETGLACVLDGDSQRLGLVGRDASFQRIVEATGDEIGAAHHRGHFYVCRSECIDVVVNGQSRSLLQAEPGRQFFGIELGRWRGGAYLAVASGSMNSRARPSSIVEFFGIYS